MASSCQRHLAHWAPPTRRLFVILPPLLILATFCLFLTGGRLWDEWLNYRPSRLTSPSAAQHVEPVQIGRSSLFSFDLTVSEHPAWMAAIPDDWSLAQLTLLGTHDTFTHRVHDEVYQCQNTALSAQLRAGVRYLDVRARVQIPDESDKNGEDDKDASAPWPLGIYHADMYTGYELSEVAATVFAFLDENPSETVVMRLKEEGKPITGVVGDAPGRRNQTGDADTSTGSRAQTQPSPYEASFNWYRLKDPRTAPGFADHLYRFPTRDAHNVTLRQPTRVPTMGELRGKMLLLQEFPYFPLSYQEPTSKAELFGIPWDLSSALLQVEDFYVVSDLAHLEDKWAAIQENLQAATQAVTGNNSKEMPLFLSHLSASVGVLPIDAAAGPEDRTVMGMNDRAGQWLESSHDDQDGGEGASLGQVPVGIVIADFPGQRLLEAILRRNYFS